MTKVDPSLVWHRVESYKADAKGHRSAAANWRSIAGECDASSKRYYLVLELTQRDLALTCERAAGLLAEATEALAAEATKGGG